MSETIKYSWAEPGAAEVILLPNWTEEPEPGAVNWTIRMPLSKGKSAASLHPGLEQSSFARPTSETGITTTSSFKSTFFSFAPLLASPPLPSRS
jgi:hypothetical protein